jgi:hypothetical protein
MNTWKTPRCRRTRGPKKLTTWMNYGRLQNSKQGACKLFFIFPYLIWLLVSLSRYHMFILACIRSSLTNNRVVFFLLFYNKNDILLNFCGWIPVIPDIMTHLLIIVTFNFCFVKSGSRIATIIWTILLLFWIVFWKEWFCSYVFLNIIDFFS